MPKRHHHPKPRSVDRLADGAVAGRLVIGMVVGRLVLLVCPAVPRWVL